jgi:hypothetical protein
MDVGDLRKLFQDFSRASRVLDKEGRARACKLAVVLESYLEEKICDVIDKANGRPLLFLYQADGTSQKLAVHSGASTISDVRIDRQAYETVDFELQRLVALTESAGGAVISAMKIGPPAYCALVKLLGICLRALRISRTWLATAVMTASLSGIPPQTEPFSRLCRVSCSNV